MPPQARGFTIVTPEGEARDLGNAFGVNVGPSGSDVHVLDGEVEIPSLERDGRSRRMAADPGVFQLSGEVGV